MTNRHITPKYPKGGRKPVPGDLIARTHINQYRGLDGKHPQYLLSLFNRAAVPILGLPRGAAAVYNYLFSCTNKKDWSPNSLALVWPSNEQIMNKTGIADLKTLKRHMRALRIKGLIGFKDSPSRARSGKRNSFGKIDLTVSFGIILNPIAGLARSLEKQIADYDAYKARKKKLRRLKTSLKRTAQELDMLYADYMSETDFLRLQSIVIRSLRRADSHKDLACIETCLTRLEKLLNHISNNIIYFRSFEAALSLLKTVFIDYSKTPKGGHNTPSIRTITRTTSIYSNGLSDNSSDEKSDQNRLNSSDVETPSYRHTQKAHTGTKTARRLIRLLPQALKYQLGYEANLENLYELLSNLMMKKGLSPDSIADCYLTMGMEKTTIVLTILFLKEPGIRSLNKYIYGMITAHRARELNLTRSLFGLEAEAKKITNRPHQYSFANS